MSFPVAVPMTGHAGWAFLQRTRTQQQEAHAAAPAIKRPAEHFRETIASISSVEQLVSDRRLREVALGAFGLDEDINSLAFIRDVLASNTSDPTSLASRLADKRYLALARTFGFGDLGGPRTADPGFAEQILSAFQDRRFEISVGEKDPDLRLALGLERELAQVNERDMSDDARWYTVMATPPLRRVFEVALGLPASFGSLDIERQLNEFRMRAEDRFGSGKISDFSDPERREALTSSFLTGAQAQAVARQTAGGGQLALTLLSSIQPMR